MKSKYVILASALMISVSSFAQKDQIKAAEKALKGGNAVEAINQLKQAEGTIGAASDNEKAQYQFIKGNAHLDLASKKMEVAKNLTEAGKAYQQVLAIEKTSGKSKYSAEALTSLSSVKNKLLTAAQDESKKDNNKGAADLLYAAYDIDKTNLENLYYAASYYMTAQDYDKALQYFEELKKSNFTGESTNYYAKNAVNEQEEFYGSDAEAKKNRDNQVRLKLATTPRDEKVASKRADIAKYVALIYVQQGKNEQAKAAIADAKAANPDDVSLLSAEADVYLKMGDMDTYKKLISQIVEKNPTDANLFFNLGVASSKTDPVAAEGYYKKAIELKPDLMGAHLNLAILKMRDEQKIVDEMNKLGTSDKDNKRYEVLKKQRDDMFRSAIPHLEKAYEIKPDEDVANTLLNVYGALEMTDKKKALKAKMGK
jgi:tetratricopeptide (TPR) repeat protein